MKQRVDCSIESRWQRHEGGDYEIPDGCYVPLFICISNNKEWAVTNNGCYANKQSNLDNQNIISALVLCWSISLGKDKLIQFYYLGLSWMPPPKCCARRWHLSTQRPFYQIHVFFSELWGFEGKCKIKQMILGINKKVLFGPLRKTESRN